ncbi:hypothetical protein J6TS2_44370 [Heyndrickxia sporothermodurans]|nr:hypothetical protein J6TS2_44370 [Heyndrickxia sporothermodurans]
MKEKTVIRSLTTLRGERNLFTTRVVPREIRPYWKTSRDFLFIKMNKLTSIERKQVMFYLPVQES